MSQFGPDIFYHPLRQKPYGKVTIIFQGPVNYERRKVVGNIMDNYKSTSTLVSDIMFKEHIPGPHSPRYDWQVTVSDEELSEFYGYCRFSVEEAFENLDNLIIIDQSRIESDDLNYYVQLAQRNYHVILTYPILLDYEGGCNVSAAGGIGNSAVDAPKDLLKHLFCAWFLDGRNTIRLRKYASSYLMECFNGVDEFRNMLNEYLNGKEPKSYYNLDTEARDLAFCTVKIVDDPLNFRNYTKTERFKKNYGCPSELEIVGFVISPHTISAIVRLKDDQRLLWDMQPVDENSEVTVFPSEMLKDSKIGDFNESLSSLQSFVIIRRLLLGYIMPINNFCSDKSCHFALGKSDDATPRNVDYDVPFAVQKEKILFQGVRAANIETHSLQNCVVRRTGNYWFLYMKGHSLYTALFATCCTPANNERIEHN